MYIKKNNVTVVIVISASGKSISYYNADKYKADKLLEPRNVDINIVKEGDSSRSAE